MSCRKRIRGQSTGATMKSSMASTARPDQDAVDFLPRPLPVCPRIVNSILMAPLCLALFTSRLLTDAGKDDYLIDGVGDIRTMTCWKRRTSIEEVAGLAADRRGWPDPGPDLFQKGLVYCHFSDLYFPVSAMSSAQGRNRAVGVLQSPR